MPKHSTSSPRRWPWIAAGLAVVCAIAAGLGWWFFANDVWVDASGNRVSAAERNTPMLVWSAAEPMPAFKQEFAEEKQPAVSANGQEIFFVRTRAGERAHIYMSRISVEGWRPPQLIASLVTNADDVSPCPSPDGQFLYFASNRAGGKGGFDLYAAPRKGDSFGEAVSLGPAVNTPYDDIGPAPAPGGQRLYFSSNRLARAGNAPPRAGESPATRPGQAPVAANLDPNDALLRQNFDLFASDLSAPAAGALPRISAARELEGVNSAFCEIFCRVSPAGDFLYFASNRAGGLGGFDLYRSRIHPAFCDAAENLGSAVNTPANELDPHPTGSGFDLFFSSDRAASLAGRHLYAATAREVMPHAEARPLPRLGWSLWLLLGATVAMAPLVLLLRGINNRSLTLVQRCMLISIMAHLGLTIILSGVSVSQQVVAYVKHESGADKETRLDLTLGKQIEAAQIARNESSHLPIDSPPPSDLARNDVPSTPIERSGPLVVSARPVPLRPGQTALKVDLARSPISTPVVPLDAQQRLDAKAPQIAVARLAPVAPTISPKLADAPDGAAGKSPLAIVKDAPKDAPGTNVPRPDVSVQSAVGDAAPLHVAPQLALPDLVAPKATSPRLAVAPNFAPSLPNASVAPADQPGASVAAAQSPRQGGDVSATRPSAAGAAAGDLSVPAVQQGGGSLLANPALKPDIASDAVALVAPRITIPQLGPSLAGGPALSPSTRPAGDAPPAADSSAAGAASPSRASDVVRAERPGIAMNDATSIAPVSPLQGAGGNGVGSAAGDVHIKISQPGAAPIAGGKSPSPQAAVSPLPGNLGPQKLTTIEGLAQRSFDLRKELVQKQGGNKQSEEAVMRALLYLSRVQERDGHWTLINDERAPGQNLTDPHDIALTGLAALSFLASDHTPATAGPYRDTITRAMDWLVAQQHPDGDLRGEGDMYNHGIASIALAEAAEMTRDPRYRQAALKAADFIVRAQHDESGGWRYAPNQVGDTSISGWQVMALHSAQRLGFQVPEKTRLNALKWFDHVGTGKEKMIAAYQGGRDPSPVMTAEAAFGRMLLGQSFTPDQEHEITSFLLDNPPNRPLEADADQLNPYYIYYGSLTMMQIHNDSWEKWNNAVRDELVRSQDRKTSDDEGSWPPVSRWAEAGGRVYTTALATLTLEVYYRYLPMYSGGNTR